MTAAEPSTDAAAEAGTDRPAALVVDYGGVLTTSLTESTVAWCESDGIDVRQFAGLMAEWFGEPAGTDAVTNPVHALEIGQLTLPDFEQRLAERLRTRTGDRPVAAGLVSRMFAGFRQEPAMVTAVRRAKTAGLATALLSNSWGLDYPREGWDEMFDVTVISGEVGLRKPDPRIYQLVAQRLGLPAGRCVFVDDLRPNVRAAVDVGMIGVHHTDADTTLGELEAIFEVSLRP